MSRSRADDLIAQADAVCKAINRVGATAETEEDVRINVDAALRPILAELHLRTEPRFEQGVQRGVLEHVGIPRYDPANELHRELAEVGRLARETGAADEVALERLASRLWSPS